MVRVEIIVETIFNGGPDRDLGGREKLLHRLGQNVRGSVPENGLSLVGIKGYDRYTGIVGKRRRKVA